jgi:DNA-binding MarR family transcriptional regulator
MPHKEHSRQHAACHCTALRKAARRVNLLYDRYLVRSGLTAGQFSILSEIQSLTRISLPSLSGLATTLVMDRTALSHTLQPLERDGLIRFSASRQDRRIRLVQLTALGRKRVAAAETAWLQAQAHFARVFGEHQATALRALLTIAANTNFGEILDEAARD